MRSAVGWLDKDFFKDSRIGRYVPEHLPSGWLGDFIFFALEEGLMDTPLVQQGDFHCEDWGVIPYPQAYFQQKKRWEEVRANHGPFLIFCEHPLVLTLGRLSQRRYVLCPEDELARRKVELVEIDRGGEVTLHCPGQLVVYPVLNLERYRKDLHWYLHKLEQVAIDLLNEFDILSTRISGRTGVWVGSRKIVSIGVGVRRWITYHGLALNVNNDLSDFNLIKPCGLDVTMTSVQQELGTSVDLKGVKSRFAFVFAERFRRRE